MKQTLLLTSLCTLMLCACLGEKTPSFDNPIDPDAGNYQQYPSRSLFETGGMVDDFEDGDSISLLGTISSNWGPEPDVAAGTNWALSYTNSGGSATTSPKGHLRLTANFGTGTQNYSGVSLISVDGKGQPYDLRGYQGLVFQFRGDPGALKVSFGSPLILDGNDASVILEVVPHEWKQVYIPLDDSLFVCNYKPGCPLLSEYLHQVSAISFNLGGWSSTTRKLDVDLVQLIAKGEAIPSSAQPMQQYRITSAVETRTDQLLFDFNELPYETGIIDAFTGVHANFWGVVKADLISIAVDDNGATAGSYRSLKMDYAFTDGKPGDTQSMAGLNVEMDPSFSGRDLTKAKGLRFYIKNSATGIVDLRLRLWSDMVQKAQGKDYDAPEYVITATKDWQKVEVLFENGQKCAYYGSTDCPSYGDVLKQIQSFQFVVAINQSTPLTGTLWVDDIALLY